MVDAIKLSNYASEVVGDPAPDQDLRFRASKALQFLNCHPAVTTPAFGDFMTTVAFWVSRVAANGVGDDEPIHVDEGTPRFDEFKKSHEVDEELRKVKTIMVHYDEYFGEIWRFDHVIYCCDICLTVFAGDVKNQHDDIHNEKWNRYQGLYIKATSFEAMLVEAATQVATNWGDFDDHKSFLTPEESANHSTVEPFNFVPTDDKENAFRNEKLFAMLENKDWMTVTSGEHNRRWLKWFVKSPWCQDNWAGEFVAIAEGYKVDVTPVPINSGFIKP